MMYQCKQCPKEFEKPAQLAHHVSWEHGRARESLAQQKAQRQLEYEKIPKLCGRCSAPIPYEERHNKFCNQTCAAIYNNEHRVDDAERIGECPFCGKIFKKKSWSIKKFCCPKHAHQYQSLQLKTAWLETGIVGNWTGGKDGSAPKVHYVMETLREDQHNTCAICHRPNEWEGRPLVLILDHTNGDSTNNNRGNLRLICPNCNSQTSTFSGRNKGQGRKSKGYYKNR